MKIKTFNKTYSEQNPYQCNHEWREFGTRLEEEVWIPVGRPPSEIKDGWVICDKCGWNPFVNKYRVTGKREYFPFGKDDKIGKEFYVPWYDYLVEVIDFGNEKSPTKPIVKEFAYCDLH
jgi:hypothetical protein